MNILYTGLILGLMGSFHCVGMCGPIALSLPLRGRNFAEKFFSGLSYNLGRVLTYATMGAFFGVIGQGFQMVGFQRWVSIAMGTIMILAVVLPSLFTKVKSSNTIPYASWVRAKIGKLFKQRSYGGLFLVGLLNGLLPCGLVYMAIAGAVGTSDFYTSILFMVLFGLGTIPMLLAISFLGNLITVSVRNKINKIIPYVVVVVGLIFILRGLALGIPYLSPPQEKLNPEIHQQHDNNGEKAKPCCH